MMDRVKGPNVTVASEVTEFDILSCGLNGQTLIEASAGTGKTWNICGLYLRMLLEENYEVSHILVVTFTTAATAELQERIRERIAHMLAFLQGADHVINDAFLQKLAAKMIERGINQEEMTRRLQFALQGFDDASIFTIHSFCQRALTSTAFSAGHAFSLRLEPDDQDLVMEVIQDFWRRHIAEGDLTPAMAAFLLKKEFRPDRLLPIFRRELAKPLAERKWPEEIDQTLDLHFAELQELHQEIAACWKTERDQIIDLLMSATTQLDQKSYKPTSLTSSAKEYDKMFFAENPLTISVREEVLNRFKTSTLVSGTKKNQETPSHRFFDLLEAFLNLREQALQSLEMGYLQLIKKLLEEVPVLRQRKQDQRVIAYDDMLYNLYAALQNPDYPLLAESIRKRFPVALIDEFQDTDPLQLSIFNAIYGNTDCPVFLVGDPKQAIYSFRNADLHTYLAVQKQVATQYTLTQNQRSTFGLIKACNTLFYNNKNAFMLSDLHYYPVTASERPRPAFIDRTTGATPAHTSMQIWRLQDENGDFIERNQAKITAVDATADEIARLLLAARNQEILIDDRPLRAGDIAVLVRSHAQANLVRQALRLRNIGSVALSQENVFHSLDAHEMECLLAAILMPTRDTLRRSALATEIMGFDAHDIEAISKDKNQSILWVERFIDYHALWLKQGLGFMLRQFLTREGVYTRMLCRPDGERRLTNLLHLTELLSHAAETQLSPEALLRWLQERHAEDSSSEEAQLRLESDQKLVQIITIHKAKGLEYAIVFCPFLWDAYKSTNQSANSRTKDGVQYHEGAQTIIDFRLLDKERVDEIKKEVQIEEAMESLRLVYVALTRAVYRCYLIAGCYSRSRKGGNTNTTESTRGLLNWLVAGADYSPQEWLYPPARPKNEPDNRPDLINNAWTSLQEMSNNTIQVRDLPKRPAPFILNEEEEINALKAAPGPVYVPMGWKTSSFSGLTRGALHEAETGDHDERVQNSPLNPPQITSTPSSLSAVIPADDILFFPRGTFAGNCIHALMEHADFSHPSTWDNAIEQALLAYPQVKTSSSNSSPDQQKALLKDMLVQMMNNLVNTPLVNDITLSRIKKSHRLNELEFYLPTQEISPDSWNRCMQSLGYEVPHLTFSKLQGYLKGFIDLVFEHGGRYYLLDWKSNHLGYNAVFYEEEPMQQAMAEHGYHLQYLLYTLALHRYLEQRIPDYQYETHFGGAIYLFVRGVRPDWKRADGKPCGVYFHCLDQSVLNHLDALLSSTSNPKGDRV